MKKETHAKPYVIEEMCNGCSQCFQDCPYNAIRMIPRENEKEQQYSYIDPAKCVSCGICIGSCNPVGIVFPELPSHEIREKMNRWLASQNTQPFIAFLCAESAARGLSIDTQTGLCAELPGYLVISVPCIGWVHPLLIERAFRKGAQGVLMAGCGPGEPYCRLGTDWTTERLDGMRSPSLRQFPEKVCYVQCDRTAQKEFLEIAQQFYKGQATVSPKPSVLSKIMIASLLVSALGSLIVGFNHVGYGIPVDAKSEFIVSFKHSGQFAEQKETMQNNENLLSHMRSNQISKRRVRVSVRLAVAIDGQPYLQKSYKPHGLFGDGKSIALESIPITPGQHHIRVQIGETSNPEEWHFSANQTLTFKESERRVVLFEQSQGFQWY